MRHLLRWTKSSATWIRSRSYELPAITADQDPVARQWRVIAGGVALILSRASGDELAHRFRDSHLLYIIIRRALRKGEPVRMPTDFLVDVMHETAELVDPVTKRALQDRFRVAVQGRRAFPSAPAAPPIESDSQGSSMGSSAPSTQSQAREDMLSQLALEDASRALRKVVATARASNFGEPLRD